VAGPLLSVIPEAAPAAKGHSGTACLSPGAEWVVPRGLDRYGLELLVFAVNGIAAVRLSFPDGPVSSLDDVPVSLRAALTCRCRAEPGHGSGPGPGSRGGRR
jgi:hypothetical protein